jgi:SAM-dependent methyltransferase
MKAKAEAPYNERLFSSGVRKRLHMARFLWLRQRLRDFDCPAARIVELGCFDGKVLEFLPRKPDYYVGYDANWEGGVDLAREKWASHPNYHFRICTTPTEMDLASERFDVAIAMETLEHIPEEILRPYLAKLASVTDQYIFITVPNEKGIVFFFKHIVKLLFGEVEDYSPAEFVSATLGRMHKVPRGQHKGFDYARLARLVGEYFDVVEITGLPASSLPAALNFTVGIVGRKMAASGADRS